MTKEQIETVLDRVPHFGLLHGKRTPPAILLAMEAEELGAYQLSEEERADIEAALAEDRGG
jgi:hypothetical protein